MAVKLNNSKQAESFTSKAVKVFEVFRNSGSKDANSDLMQLAINCVSNVNLKTILVPCYSNELELLYILTETTYIGRTG